MTDGSYTEVKEGRGTPHGGAFLDISYLPADRVQKKLPSMYHQFLELADVDITKGPMEVGPTTHYMMGGIRVEPDTAAALPPDSGRQGLLGGGSSTDRELGDTPSARGRMLPRRVVLRRNRHFMANRHCHAQRTAVVSPTSASLAASSRGARGGHADSRRRG